VTGVSEGSAVIKARVNIYANSKTTTGELFCNVTVTGTPNLESITFSEPTKAVAPGSTVLLVPDLNPNGSTARLLWTSSDETIATVDENGLVTAVKEGTVTIVVSAEETSIVATCTITVSDAAPVENDVLTLNRTRIELYPGESFYLKVVSGSTGTPTWASSNPTLATVSASGRVTANSVGTVTITATENGKSASCTLTVIPRRRPHSPLRSNRRKSRQQSRHSRTRNPRKQRRLRRSKHLKNKNQKHRGFVFTLPRFSFEKIFLSEKQRKTRRFCNAAYLHLQNYLL